MMEKGNDLLTTYLGGRTEKTFRAIVQEHSAMVQATAARKLNGDLNSAQDISQQVFLRLAQSASKLTSDICLAGWLYRQTCRISLDAIRADSRRRKRESTAADLMKQEPSIDQNPLATEIDDALETLNASERDAIVLRYLEEKSHRSVGEQLGISEEAARKRCNRAVETLRAFFTKRGSGFTTSALVTALTGLATPPLPAATIDTLTKTAFQKSGTTTMAGGSLLSFVGGLAIASLTAGGVYLSKNNQASETNRPITIDHPNERQQTIHQIKQGLSVKSVIDEVKLLYLQPRNSLMKLRLIALFEALPLSERAEFFRQSADLLTSHEKVFCYRPFLEFWSREDPVTAFDLIFSERLATNAFAGELGTIEYLFRQWRYKSPEQAEGWLRENWEQEDLKTEGFGNNLRSQFAQGFIKNTLYKHGAKASISKAASFGNQDDFLHNMRALTGTLWNSVETKYAVDLYREIRRHPDSNIQKELTKRLLENWKSRSGDHLMASLEKLDPVERIPAALFTLDYEAPAKTVTQYANGSSGISYSRTERSPDERVLFLEKREAELREIGAAAGLSGKAIDHMMISQYFSRKDERALDLLDRLPPGQDSDQLILDGMRTLAKNEFRGSAKLEVIAFNAALSLSDPDRKVGTIRSLYHRIANKDPKTAADMLAYPDFPPKVSSALHEISKSYNP